jgi:hypothetical protein
VGFKDPIGIPSGDKSRIEKPIKILIYFNIKAGLICEGVKSMMVDT